MKLVLIDRDGVLNRELPGYVTQPSELDIFPAAIEAVALLKRNGFTCVVITNQSVVGRNIITLDELQQIHDHLRASLAVKGATIDDVIACPDAPEAASHRRKPSPGMLQEALSKYSALPARTPFIGDALTDLQAAYAAGCPRYLVKTGKGHALADAIPSMLEPVTVCEDVLDAARRIVTVFG